MRKAFLFTSEPVSEKHAGKTSRQKHVEHSHFNDHSLILEWSDTLFLSPFKSAYHG
ncbi:MAG: hypothetical protein H8E61_00300 [Bacteroidetes bacterium]|nr:hypothetical protein [Bacteroidota bacterium]